MDQKKIWDHYQADTGAHDIFLMSLPRYEFLAQHVDSGSDVLNVGVARGGLEKMLLRKHANVSCLDPSEGAVKQLRAELGLGERAKVGYSQAMPFGDGVFDVVIMSEVLEHLADEVLQATMAEVLRVLRPGGRFIGTVPAEEVLRENQVICPDCGKSFHRWGHVQRFDEMTLTDLFAGQFQRLQLSRHHFGAGRYLNWKGRLGLYLKRLMMALGIKGSNETYFFSASNR